MHTYSKEQKRLYDSAEFGAGISFIACDIWHHSSLFEYHQTLRRTFSRLHNLILQRYLLLVIMMVVMKAIKVLKPKRFRLVMIKWMSMIVFMMAALMILMMTATTLETTTIALLKSQVPTKNI